MNSHRHLVADSLVLFTDRLTGLTGLSSFYFIFPPDSFWCSCELNTPQMLKTPTNFFSFLRGRRAVYRVAMATSMWRRLAGSEMSVSLTVSRPCSCHGSPSSHSCAPPLEVFPTGGRNRELWDGVCVCVCEGGMLLLLKALTHMISYLQSPGV